jgi:hypothetical protein
MPLFSHTTVPPLISLLNSNSIPALSPLWSTTTDALLPEDSVVCVLQDDAPDEAYSANQGFESTTKLLLDASVSLVPKRLPPIGSIAQPVIHLQSPTIRTTYIQAGAPLASSDALGIGLAYVGMQVKPLGERPFAVEFGIVDHAGNQGRIRISTFQVCFASNRVSSLIRRRMILCARRSPHSGTRHLVYQSYTFRCDSRPPMQQV